MNDIFSPVFKRAAIVVYRESTKLKKRMVSVPSLSRGKDCIVVLEFSKGQSVLCCMSAVVNVCVTL